MYVVDTAWPSHVVVGLLVYASLEAGASRFLDLLFSLKGMAIGRPSGPRSSSPDGVGLDGAIEGCHDPQTLGTPGPMVLGLLREVRYAVLARP